MTNVPSTYEIVSSVSTAVAAAGNVIAVGYAVWSTRLSRRSTLAAEEAVNEARMSRQNEVLPRFTLDRNFLDFKFQWPNPDEQKMGPVCMARKSLEDAPKSPPSLRLSNVSERPALELTVSFLLIDQNEPFDIPEKFSRVGLSTCRTPIHIAGGKIPQLECRNPPDGTHGSGHPLYKQESEFVPNCVPNEPRFLEIPAGVLNRLFVRGLQYNSGSTDKKDMVLIVRIAGYTVEGDPISEQFRYHVNPFCYGPNLPIKVYVHFWELPMRSRDESLVQTQY